LCSFYYFAAAVTGGIDEGRYCVKNFTAGVLVIEWTGAHLADCGVLSGDHL